MLRREWRPALPQTPGMPPRLGATGRPLANAFPVVHATKKHGDRPTRDG